MHLSDALQLANSNLVYRSLGQLGLKHQKAVRDATHHKATFPLSSSVKSFKQMFLQALKKEAGDFYVVSPDPVTVPPIVPIGALGILISKLEFNNMMPTRQQYQVSIIHI